MYLIGLGLVVSFIWGLIPIIDKFVLISVDPKIFILMFATLFFFCTLIFTFLNRNSILLHIKTVNKHNLMLTFCSSLLAFVALLVYLFLLKDNDSHLVSAIAYSAPMFTLILAMLILKERPTLISIAGILLIIMGVWCIAFKN